MESEAEQDESAPFPTLPPLSPDDVEATLVSAPGRPRASVSATFPHASVGYLVALDLPSNYTGEVSVVARAPALVVDGGGGSGAGDSKKAASTTATAKLGFGVLRSPARVLVTASLPVE